MEVYTDGNPIKINIKDIKDVYFQWYWNSSGMTIGTINWPNVVFNDIPAKVTGNGFFKLNDGRQGWFKLTSFDCNFIKGAVRKWENAGGYYLELNSNGCTV